MQPPTAPAYAKACVLKKEDKLAAVPKTLEAEYQRAHEEFLASKFVFLLCQVLRKRKLPQEETGGMDDDLASAFGELLHSLS